MSQPQSGEDALEMSLMMTHSGMYSVIVVDSVAALVPKVEIEKEVGDSVMGVQAKMMSQAMRKLVAPINKSGVVFIFINQVRSNIGGWGSPEVTSGGKGLRFAASVRIKMKHKGLLKDGDEVVGTRIEATVVKNKFAPPHKSATFIIDGDGINDSENEAEWLVETGVLTKNGAFYKIGEEVYAHGLTALRSKIKDQTERKRFGLI